MYRVKWTLLCLCFLSLMSLAACGRNIPVIDPALLESKSSILMITRPHLPDALYAQIGQTLNSWRDQHHIAYEWLPGTAALQEEQTAKVRAGAYDYIIVVGTEPVRNLLPLASSMPEKRWIFLDDAMGAAVPAITEKHISLRHVPEGLIQSEWDEWVRQQLVTGRMIEWVTTAAYPIPADWAPSEEAECITLADANGWFQQLQFQVKSHGPAWIVTYAPIDSASMQRLRTLQVPVMNLASTVVDLQWDAILKDIREQLVSHTLKPGSRVYQTNEMKVIKSS